ncbi:hypothetical protein CVU83_00500 [Candidatus Falkowbacteria bacterium HGW-Falkowbacteria-2]|uniref:Polyprenyl synthetase n=1 Tax=Candidatus Falkowbacteria bacterium HGW-Falkowbacteria-2 TaxID=2013769 RepID=A0A2N2E3A0_9BACT|nr:MAG: hypothetical protein CVU83_00500 [Candidatus Falkowbacteria bacterium HGW-Falkowbacteria-2]
MPTNKLSAVDTAEIIISQWPNNLRQALRVQWQKTISDDKSGLISGLPSSILSGLKGRSSLISLLARELGAANLFLWTAANFQDDVYDEADAPKSNIPLANACLHAAWSLIPRSNSLTDIIKVSLEAEDANLHEITKPQTIQSGVLAPAGKSSFLLMAPLALTAHLNWPKSEIDKLTLALRYFLSAKQLADDTYDYKEDWQKGRRTFAHRGLKRLPTKNELPPYFKRLAHRILRLTSTCRGIIKTIPALDGDCLDIYLSPLETNCRHSLANLNQSAPQV